MFYFFFNIFNIIHLSHLKQIELDTSKVKQGEEINKIILSSEK